MHDQETKQRRRILTGGVAAGASTLLLPGQWTRPVVKGVLTPVHAQTTPQQATPPQDAESCPNTDTIEGVSFGCDDDPVTFGFLYSLSNGCLTREPTTEETPDSIVVDFQQTVNGVLLNVIVGGSGFGTTLLCDTPSDADTPWEEDFDVDGVPYRATFTVGRTQTPPTVFVSDILVAPVP